MIKAQSIASKKLKLMEQERMISLKLREIKENITTRITNSPTRMPTIKKPQMPTSKKIPKKRKSLDVIKLTPSKQDSHVCIIHYLLT